MKIFERIVETGLWRSRLIMMFAVIASLGLAAGMIFVVTVDVFYQIGQIAGYANPTLTEAGRATLRLDIIGASVGIVDGYLLSAVLVVFGLGLYELFVGNIEILRNSEVGARLLHIQSIEDLKDRLGRVVLLVLVVKFAQLALQHKYEAPVDLLYLAIGITLIGAGLYLTTHRAGHHSASNLSR